MTPNLEELLQARQAKLREIAKELRPERTRAWFSLKCRLGFHAWGEPYGVAVAYPQLVYFQRCNHCSKARMAPREALKELNHGNDDS